MLTPPPCIRYFVDCQGDDVFTDEAQSNATSLSSSAASLPASDARQDAFDRLTNTGISSSTLRRATADTFAAYTIKVRNLSSEHLRGLRISHGPLPFGATFDANKSASQCTQSEKKVICLTDLAPGASRDFVLTYKVNSAFSCAFARLLQSAATTIAERSGSSSPVLTTVACSLITSDSSPDASDSFDDVLLARRDGATGTGSGQLLVGALVKDPLDSDQSKQAFDAFKPYQPVVLPRTGGSPYVASSMSVSSTYTLQKVEAADVDFSVRPILFLAVLSAIGLLLLRSKYVARYTNALL